MAQTQTIVKTTTTTKIKLDSDELEALLLKHFSDKAKETPGCIVRQEVEFDVSSGGYLRGVEIEFEVEITI